MTMCPRLPIEASRISNLWLVWRKHDCTTAASEASRSSGLEQRRAPTVVYALARPNEPGTAW